MLPGPIFRREARAAARGNRMLTLRLIVGLPILFLLLAPILAELITGRSLLDAFGAGHEVDVMRVLAIYAVGVTFGLELMILSLLAAESVGAAIAEEREKDTLPSLLLTRLTRFELVAVKLAGRLMPTLLTTLLGLPILVVGAWLVDLPARLIALAMAAIVTTVIASGSLGILASSRRERSGTASAAAAGWTFFWLLGVPVATLLPLSSGTLWGELLIELRRIAGWLSPSSPLSLLTDRSWYNGIGDDAGRLAHRLLIMMAMQAALIAMAMAAAVAAMRRREPRAEAPDVRPPVGDDPIYWREYELPRRKVSRWIVVGLAARLLAMLRILLVMALQITLLAAALALLIGLFVAAGWLGIRSFRECWGLDASTVSSFEAREAFNAYIRYMTFFLGPLLAMGTASGVVGHITGERDRKTMDSLLMTPMTGPEILASKMRVAMRTSWLLDRWLIPLWLLGIACGALHPLGVVLSALALLATVRLVVALGIRAAIRPGATTQSANTSTGHWGLLLMLIGLATIVAPLCSAREIQIIRERTPGFAEAWVVSELVVIAAMAAIGRAIRLRSFERFDEWVGRPHRDAEAPATSGPSPLSPARTADDRGLQPASSVTTGR